MLKILKRLSKREWLMVFLVACCVVFQVGMELSMPGYMSEITVLVQTPGSAMNAILAAGGKMLLCALGSVAGSICAAILSARISSDFSFELRAALFGRVESFSMEEIGRFSTASLITRSTNDVTQVAMVIAMGLQIVIRVPVMATWAISKIAGKASQWTLSTGVAVIVLLAVVITCMSLAIPKFRRLQELTDNINRVTRENLTGLRVVRAYNAEAYQEAKFDKANAELTNTHLFAGRVMAFMNPGINLVMNGLALSVYWLGAYLISRAALAERVSLLSDMVVFSQYAMQIVMSFMMLVMIFMFAPRASVAANRIEEVLNTEPTIRDGQRTSSDPEAAGEVEFRDVSFAYPGSEEPVVRGISFAAHRGETVALIGATGSGKSTIVNLIPRFYDVSSGEVLVDGHNVKEYTQEALRSKIGHVAQSAVLFQGSVEYNIGFGDNGKGEKTRDQIREAVAIAQSTDFVESLEDGYEGYVAQGGTNFSGGQKQRLSIARAIARDAEILIFDDSFSALDYKTDRNLRKALAEHCKDATKIIVAQRIGTIRDADRILVLDDGEIVGQGTHDELMTGCEVYRQIARSQLSEEELA